MGAIRLTQFGGIVPRTSERLIPDNAAQIAANVRLTDGELVPTYDAKTVYTTGKSGDQLAMFRASDGASYAWLTWPYDVDAVRSPLSGTTKWIFTGDGEPRITTLAMAISGGGTSYPNTYYTLGIPKPVNAPGVSHSGGTGAAVSRVYVYTFFSQWGEESAPSPANVLADGKVDGTWAITGMDAVPVNSGTVSGAFASGETTFDNTTPHWLRVGEEVVIDSVTLVVTAVPTVATFKVAGDYHASTAWARKAPWNTTSMKRRLYRSAGTNATYQLVNDDVGTTYDDTLSDAEIMGDEMISDGWLPPPVGLKGIFMLPSGSWCGFVGNTLHFSEPYQPHACVAEYEMSAMNEIVSAASYGTGIGVGTTVSPYIITGVDPGQMSGVDWPEVLPCQSKRSLVSVGDMVLYSSPMGMISLSASGAAIWSLGYFTDQEWKALNAETMVAAYAGRRLFMHYVDDYSNHGALVFNLLGDSSVLTEAAFHADEMYSDAVTGKLYFMSGQEIKEYDNDEQYVSILDWMSKEFVLPKPQNLGAAKVDFDSAFDAAQAALIEAAIAAIEASNAAILATGNAHGSWNSRRYNQVGWNASELQQPPSLPPTNQVSFSLYVDGALKFSKVVTSGSAFRLPGGYKTDRVAVRVVSQCRIRGIAIGETMKSLEMA